MNPNKNILREKGFTLIEVMIVVGITALLVAIAIPAYNQYRTKAFDISATSDMRHLFLFENSFFNIHQIYVPIATTDKNSSGSILKNVTIDGKTVAFTVNSLTRDVSVFCATNGVKQSIIVAAKHLGGSGISAVDLENPGVPRFKITSHDLIASDLPAVTFTDDLNSW